MGLPELQSLPDVSPPVGHGLERGRVSGRGRPLGNGPILGVARDLRGVTRQTDRAQDRILHRAGVISGLSYRQEVANASCPLVDVDLDGFDDLRMIVDSADLGLTFAHQVLPVTGRLDSGRQWVATAPLQPVSMLPDSDFDGVQDDCDACAGTAPGTPIDETGCP